MPRLSPELPAQLTSRLESSHGGRGEVRRWRRRCEPELAYGRHFGPIRRSARQAAVVAGFYFADGQWWLPLTKRAADLQDHPGQISLPGGMVEPSESPAEALREWEEELGDSAENVRLLGQLSPVFVFGTNFAVTPFVAALQHPPELRPNTAEVASVLALPARELIAGEASLASFPQRFAIQRRGLEFQAPQLAWEGESIWGATLQILSELAYHLHCLAE